jgi:hypothetical protein
VIRYGAEEYIGIVQNRDAHVTNFYDFVSIKSSGDREKFLQLGEQWWWGSNRQIPISIFLKTEWTEFKTCLKTFNSKDVVILHGPCVSLEDLAQKKSKKRSVTLIKKPAQ